jgi:hypothetical protein
MVLRLWWEPIIGPPRVWTISSHARRQQIGLSPSLDMQPVTKIVRVHSSIVTAPHARYKPRLGHQQGIRRLRGSMRMPYAIERGQQWRATVGKREEHSMVPVSPGGQQARYAVVSSKPALTASLAATPDTLRPQIGGSQQM